MAYDNAVAIGLRCFYSDEVRYLDLSNLETAWTIKKTGQAPVEAEVPGDWYRGVNTEQEDDHPFNGLLECVERSA